MQSGAVVDSKLSLRSPAGRTDTGERAMNSIVHASAARQEHPGQSRRGKGPAQSGTGINATPVASSHHRHTDTSTCSGEKHETESAGTA